MDSALILKSLCSLNQVLEREGKNPAHPHVQDPMQDPMQDTEQPHVHETAQPNLTPSESYKSRRQDTVHVYHHQESSVFRDALLLSTLNRPTSNVTIVQNSSVPPSNSAPAKKEEKKHSLSTQGALVLGASMVTIVGGMIYSLSSDEYVKFYTSDLEEKIQYIQRLNMDLKSIQLTELLLSYEDWKRLFVKRTKTTTIAKIGTGVSVAVVVGASILHFPLVILTGFVGVAAGGGTLLWKHLTHKQPVSEEEAFKTFYQNLHYLIKAYQDQADQEAQPGHAGYANHASDGTQPSAPYTNDNL